MIHFLIPLIGLFLFFLEPVFGLFSPLHLDGGIYYVVPRFLLMFLIFVAVYYNRKYAMFYGLFFGLLYDVFFIDIIGLYSFLYPAMCLIAAYAVKSFHGNLLVTTALTLALTALFECALYQFFVFISLTSMPLPVFLESRLLPTMIANSGFLIMLGWGFKTLVVSRFTDRDKTVNLF